MTTGGAVLGLDHLFFFLKTKTFLWVTVFVQVRQNEQSSKTGCIYFKPPKRTSNHCRGLSVRYFSRYSSTALLIKTGTTVIWLTAGGKPHCVSLCQKSLTWRNLAGLNGMTEWQQDLNAQWYKMRFTYELDHVKLATPSPVPKVLALEYWILCSS